MTMRHEVQHRNAIHAAMEFVVAGIGVTGLTPTVVIKDADTGDYWDGTVWAGTAVSLNVPEVDAVEQPGLYRLDVPVASLDPTNVGGYEYYITATSGPTTITENVTITVVEESPTYAFGGPEGTPSPVQPVMTSPVQVGTTHQVSLGVSTSPLEAGKAGAFALTAAVIDVGGTVTDLVVAGLTTPEMVEMGTAAAVAIEAAVTSVPAFSSGGGPGGEDVYDITVDDSSPYVVGQFVRGKGKGAGEGHIHEIVSLPDGTSVLVASSSANFDIVNGDTLERVLPLGTYAGTIDIDVDTYLSSANPIGTLKISMRSIGVGTGTPPKFVAESAVSWTRVLELDTTGRRFNTG